MEEYRWVINLSNFPRKCVILLLFFSETWETEDKITSQVLIAQFEESRKKKDIREARNRRTKKNKLEEELKPRGYDRNLLLEKIVGATNCTGELQFLVNWCNCEEFDLLPAIEVNTSDPEKVIEFYEARSLLMKKVNERKQLDNVVRPEKETVILNVDTESATIKTDANKTPPTTVTTNILEESLRMSDFDTSLNSFASDVEMPSADNELINKSSNDNLTQNMPSASLIIQNPIIDGQQILVTYDPNHLNEFIPQPEDVEQIQYPLLESESTPMETLQKDDINESYQQYQNNPPPVGGDMPILMSTNDNY